MGALVLQSDFGHEDGAVSAMYGVAFGVDPELRVQDLTHEIPQFDIWVDTLYTDTFDEEY